MKHPARSFQVAARNWLVFHPTISRSLRHLGQLTTREIKRKQHDEGEQHHAARKPMCRAVFHRFDMIVDGDREHARLAGDVAAQHQHHAELADRVRESKDDRSEKTGSRQRQQPR